MALPAGGGGRRGASSLRKKTCWKEEAVKRSLNDAVLVCASKELARMQ